MGHFDSVVVQPASHHFFPHNDPSSCVLYAAHVAAVSRRFSSRLASHALLLRPQEDVSWNNTDSGYMIRTFEQSSQGSSFPSYAGDAGPSGDQFSGSFSGNS